MTKKRFDEQAMEMAKKASEKILDECPELGSVVVIFGWDLPEEAVRALPAGTWFNRDGKLNLARLRTVMAQVSSMFNHAVSVSFEFLNKATSEAAEKAPDDNA